MNSSLETSYFQTFIILVLWGSHNKKCHSPEAEETIKVAARLLKGLNFYSKNKGNRLKTLIDLIEEGYEPILIIQIRLIFIKLLEIRQISSKETGKEDLKELKLEIKLGDLFFKEDFLNLPMCSFGLKVFKERLSVFNSELKENENYLKKNLLFLTKWEEKLRMRGPPSKEIESLMVKEKKLFDKIINDEN